MIDRAHGTNRQNVIDIQLDLPGHLCRATFVILAMFFVLFYWKEVKVRGKWKKVRYNGEKQRRPDLSNYNETDGEKVRYIMWQEHEQVCNDGKRGGEPWLGQDGHGALVLHHQGCEYFHWQFVKSVNKNYFFFYWLLPKRKPEGGDLISSETRNIWRTFCFNIVPQYSNNPISERPNMVAHILWGNLSIFHQDCIFWVQVTIFSISMQYSVCRFKLTDVTLADKDSYSMLVFDAPTGGLKI